ncbi:diguanylate cyclase (GGDEF)-like protein [Arthrobacter sp. BE255]|nr:diguanylate cyclase (GGDEF)-like protein [Arthrobacter sp. BE255]
MQSGDRRSVPGAAFTAPPRTWSLRREWSRAFILMLIALLVGAAVTIVGVRGVVGHVQAADSRLLLEAERTGSLRAALDAHEELGHRLLSDPAADKAAFMAQQQEISALFDAAATDLPTAESGPAVGDVRQAWQESLASHGLWSDQVDAMPGTRIAESPGFAADSARVRALLAGVQRSSLAAMDKALAFTADLELILVAARIGLFAIAVAATFYFRRRMVKDLLRPVASLRHGALKLQAGQYTHRISVHRRDELGELAEAFNAMAAAVQDSHLELTHRATHDSLTGLPNRAALMERLTASFDPEPGGNMGNGARLEGLLFIDVDDFKGVNDSLGHERGDALLIQLASRLQSCVRADDLVARLGGDEFAIVVMEDDGNSVTGDVAERIHNALRAPFFVAGDRLTVTASLGAAQRRPDTSDAAELLRQADFAMYMAKHGGKARYQLFDSRGHDHMAYRAALKSDLATAVAARQLRLEYQPVADLLTGEIVGLEALVRWQHPSLGLLGPADFLPLAEETGEIQAITCWVLETATQQAAGWRHTIGGCENLWIAVNLSYRQLPDDRTLAAVERVLADPAAQADRLVLEITEAALAASRDGGISVLTRLKALGARIAVDGFGTRAPAPGSLAALPADLWKIDGAHLARRGPAASPEAALEDLMGLARNLGVEVVAEGIESPGQLDLLRALGCRTGQGYLLARPGPAQMVEALLASGARLEHVALA